jgi:branched-chain amino acid transport system ATP-binding protein
MLELDSIDSYYGESHILHELSMHIDEGEVVGLLGRNGVGKTTTLRSIVGIVNPRSGTIVYKGENIAGLKPYQTAQKGIALVPEERRVFPNLSVEENLLIAKEGMHGTDERLELVYDVFPDLAEIQDRLGQQLSGGQQQMVAIGRGLIGDVDLLLLDEPMEGLAPVIVETVMDAIERIAKTGMTICIVEQSIMTALNIVDRAYLIDNGEIVYEDSAANLKQNEEILDRHLGVATTSE